MTGVELDSQWHEALTALTELALTRVTVVSASWFTAEPTSAEGGVRPGLIGQTTCMSDQEKRPTSESEEPDGLEHSDSPPETESLEERAHVG